ncbi:hypothetical protein FBU30_000596 [Linnemannia zychae]|nr:hypothetical protein FBU30_000596 [Linnemannia zychae]
MTTKNPHNNDDDSNAEPICAICLEPYTGRVYLSPCLHSFCAECLLTWVEVSVLCPLCKSKPECFHWGVDTALGMVTTITVAGHSPFYSTLPRIERSGSGDRSGRGTDKGSRVRENGGKENEGRAMTWKDELRNVVMLFKKQQQDKDDEKKLSTLAKDMDCESEKEQSTSNNISTSGKGGIVNTDTGMKRARSRSNSRSRSRSTAPIDSHPFFYGSNEFYSSTTSAVVSDGRLSRQESSTNSASSPTTRTHIGHVTDSIVARIPSTRREVYALGMEPSPEQEFPLADVIRPIDITFLTPFLRQDLQVLTDSQPMDPIILDLIVSLFTQYGSRISERPTSSAGLSERGHANKRQALHDKKSRELDKKKGDGWKAIEQEVAQWISLNPSRDNWSELDMARLFVQEMRRIVKKRWTVNRWNVSVPYVPILPMSPSVS